MIKVINLKIEFWLIAAILVIIGLVIVILPLWRKQGVEESDVDQQNIDIARQKLIDLKAQLGNGKIDQAQYELQLNELELALNDDLSLSQNASATQKQGRWMIGFLVVLVPVVAVSLYLILGDSSPNALLMPSEVSNIANKQPSVKQTIGTVEAMVSDLAERLKNQPDDLQGWVMLGKSYKYLQKFEKAAEAFSKANILAGTDPNVMLQYADALVMVNQGGFTAESKRLIFKALELAPDNATGLWLAGKLKAEEGDHIAAMEYLQSLRPQVEPGSKSDEQLKILMASVQFRIDGNGENAVSSAGSFTETKSIEDSIVSLVGSLKDNPNDVQAWAELGKSYKSLKQYDKAITAFEKAQLLSGKQVGAMLMYADALVMKNDGQYSEQAKKLIFKALEIKPDETTGLWLAGKSRVQEAKYSQALQYLRRAEAQLQPGSQSHKIMLSYISHVESQLPVSSAEKSVMPAVTAKLENGKEQSSAETGIQVKVALSAELKNLTKANDTVFIYAKAMSGPQMPLAIVRKKVSDLPLSVRLTDAQAMTPMMKLSKFQQVKLTARISKSGNAMPQAGDFIGVVNGVNVSSQQMVNINIDRTIN